MKDSAQNTNCKDSNVLGFVIFIQAAEAYFVL